MSTEKTITASIVQGSGVGPASYVIAAGDLKVVNDTNSLMKYADDTYTVGHKKRAPKLLLITLAIINRF